MNSREALDLISTIATISLNNIRLTRQLQEAQRQTQTIRLKENVAAIIRDTFKENPDTSNATWIAQVENLIADVRFNAMMEERIRLAREIHDGLAQTLGFLKLQIAQMQTIVDRPDRTRLHSMLQTSHKALAEAYKDIREAIDGLRISVNDIHDGSMEIQEHWIMQVINDFQGQLETRKPEIIACSPLDRTPVSSEVQAQLIRILQEALSNVRKHAHAEHVWISYVCDRQNLILGIQDDGIGFNIDDIPRLSQHGLRGMRERSELIGADLQVISQPKSGTTIRISLPIVESFHSDKD